MKRKRCARPGEKAGRRDGLCPLPQTPVFVLRVPGGQWEPTPMLSGHMPGGAHGILSLITVVFVLPEGKCRCPRAAEGARALGLRSFASSPNPACLGVI